MLVTTSKYKYVCVCIYSDTLRPKMSDFLQREFVYALIIWWLVCLGLEFQPHKFFGALIYTWRRKWQPTPVLLLGKSHGWKSLVGYSP